MTSRLSEDRSLDAAWDPASKADEEGCNAPPCAAPPAPAALATTPGPAAERPGSPCVQATTLIGASCPIRGTDATRRAWKAQSTRMLDQRGGEKGPCPAENPFQMFLDCIDVPVPQAVHAPGSADRTPPGCGSAVSSGLCVCHATVYISVAASAATASGFPDVLRPAVRGTAEAFSSLTTRLRIEHSDPPHAVKSEWLDSPTPASSEESLTPAQAVRPEPLQEFK